MPEIGSSPEVVINPPHVEQQLPHAGKKIKKITRYVKEKVFRRKSESEETFEHEDRFTFISEKIRKVPPFYEFADHAKRRRWFESINKQSGILAEQLDSDDDKLVNEGMDNLQQLVNSKDPSAQRLVSELLKEKVQLVENKFVSGDTFSRINSFSLLANLAITGDEGQKDASRAFLEQHKEQLEEALKIQYTGGYYARTVAKLFANDINIFKKDGKSIDDIYNSLASSVDKGELIASLLNSSSSSEAYKKNLAFLNEQVSPYGLNGEELLTAWSMVGTGIEELVRQNLSQIHRLEDRAAGSTQVLTKEFGIRHFYRYTVDMLLHQVDHKDDVDKPYGIILNPYSDYNGAFENNRSTFDKLQQTVSGSHNLRIIECQNTDEIKQRLVELKQRYGKNQKISFAIIGGHGTAETIQFGYGDEGHTLRIEDLRGETGESLQAGEFFEERPTIILNSCSTGKRAGIFKRGMGQLLHRLLGADVFAPDRPASIKSLRAQVIDGRVIFAVEYRNQDGEDSTKLYSTNN